MLKKLVNEAHFSLKLTTTGPVLIRSGGATLSGPNMAPVLTYRNGQREVYLPGTSLKGVFRSHLEKVGRTLNEAAICNPFDEKSFCGDKLQTRKRQGEEISNPLAYRDSCPICRLFGSTFYTGRISIDDAYLVDSSRPRPTELRDGVGIDRLTGGAAHGAKFDLEAVSPQVAFTTRLYLRNFEIWQLGMLLLVVQDLTEGLIRLGSGTSRGMGSVKGQVEQVTINHLGFADWPDNQIWGLGKFLADDPADYGTSPDDSLTLAETPPADRRGIRLERVFAGEQLAALQQQAIDVFVDRIQTWGE